MKNIKLLHYQKDIFNRALDIISRNKKVGLDIFTKGGKSYIAYALMEHLVNNGKVDNIIIVAPKAIIENLRDNVYKDTALIDRMLFLNTEKMSHGTKMTEYIKECGYDISSVNLIVYDECHHLFGSNIKTTRRLDSEFIDSCYVIAMTASSDDTIRGFNKLHALVGTNNTVRYSIVEAMNNNILKHVTYKACVLSYDKSVFEVADRLNSMHTKSEYIRNLISDVNVRINSLNNRLEDKLYDYMKANTKSLDCSKGSTGFVFFNTVSELRASEKAVTKAVKRLYNDFNNHKVTVNYIEYTSLASNEETDRAKEIINREAIPYTVNLIATVNKGGEGIHPANTQLELIMCSTQSLTRFIQMEGRINCNYTDLYNPMVFDFKSNVVAIQAFNPGTIYVGRERAYNRRSRSRAKEYSMLGMDIDEYERKTNNINFKEISGLNNIDEMVNRIYGLLTLLDDDNSSIIYVIKNNKENIDSTYYGNVYKFLSDYDKKNNTNFSTKYKLIQRYTIFNEYTSEEIQMIEYWKDLLGYRVFLTERADKEECEYTLELYNDIERQKKRLEKNVDVSTRFKNKYAVDYMCGNMRSLQCALIQQDDRIAESLLKHTPNIKASEYGIDLEDEYSKFIYKNVRALFSILSNLELDKINKEKIESATRRASARLLLLESVPVEGKLKSYCDTMAKFLRSKYSSLLEDSDNLLDNRTSSKMICIIHNMLSNALINQGPFLDLTVGYISNNYKELSDTYKAFLDIAGIKSINSFYNKVVDKSKFKTLKDNAIVNYSTESERQFKGYLTITPNKYIKEIESYKKIISKIA